MLCRSLWRKYYPEAKDNLVNIVSRCLVVEAGGHTILFDTGMGRKQKAKYYGYKHLSGSDDLTSNLLKAGYKPEDITDIVFTHLHDDHVGGATRINREGQPELVFPEAEYWVSRRQWEWARNPNKREQAAFLDVNLSPLAESGMLNLVEDNTEFAHGVFLRHFSGHTDGMLLPYFEYNDKTLVFVADLIPLTGNLPVVYLASVDIQPLVAMEEKEMFLEETAKYGYTLVFEHDFYTECATIQKSEKGFAIKETFRLEDL